MASIIVNPGPTQRVLPSLGDDAGYGFSGEHKIFTATAGTTTDADFLFTYQAAVHGGYFWCDSNAVVGDTVKVQIVDTENTLGLAAVDAFGLGVGVIDQFMHWAVVPGQLLVAKSNDISDFPAANLTIRMKYTSTGGSNVQCVVNYSSYKIL